MSLVDLWVTSGRAVIVTDSDGALPDSTAIEVAKVKALGGAAVLVAARGCAGLLDHAVAAATQQKAACVDTAGGTIWSLLPEIMVVMDREARALGLDPAPYLEGGLDVVVAGWSIDRDACFGYGFRAEPGSRTFAMREIDRATLLPGEPLLGPNPPFDMPVNDADMLAIATIQTAWCLAKYPTRAMGGRMVIAEVTKEGTSIRSGGMLPRRRACAV